MNAREIRRYRRALRSFHRLVRAQLKSCNCRGVSLPRCLVLLEVDENGPSTVGQLATSLRLDHSTLSRTVDGLVQESLVERLRDDRDRRVVRIRLTREGASLCRELHERNDDFCREVFAGISPSERLEVIRRFETLVQAYLDHEAGAVAPESRRRVTGRDEKCESTVLGDRA